MSSEASQITRLSAYYAAECHAQLTKQQYLTQVQVACPTEAHLFEETIQLRAFAFKLVFCPALQTFQVACTNCKPLELLFTPQVCTLLCYVMAVWFSMHVCQT